MEEFDQEKDKNDIIKVLEQRELYDLDGLNKLQKFVDNKNFARISLKKKQKGPDGWHIQCYHFKSKKCPYRIRFLRDRKPNGEYLDTYQLEDYVLNHQFHQDYKQIDKEIRISKNKIEKHRQLIISIYLDLQKNKDKDAKPLKIQQILLENYCIDIYDGHTSKSSQQQLKKKLDNIIRDYKLTLKRTQSNSMEIEQNEVTPQQSQTPIIKQQQNCLKQQFEQVELSIFDCLDLDQTNHDQFSSFNNNNNNFINQAYPLDDNY